MPILKNLASSGIMILTLSRPQALNALNMETLSELREVMEEIARSNEIRAVIITGEGDKAFVAGADIKELASLSPKEAVTLSRKGQDLFSSIENFPKPVIAAVNGFALGGGCELAMACHIRISSKNAKFAQPEINLGIIPGYGGTQRLRQLVGRGKSLELLMTGEMISADEALALGLVNHVVDNLMEFSQKLAEKIISKSPVILDLMIKSVNTGVSNEMEGYLSEAENFGKCVQTEDFREGTSAFLEKRKPAFKGR